MATLSRKRGIKPSSRPGPSGRKGIPPPRETSESSDLDSAMATFHNYCTHCEKQIIVPNNSILYCSEKCRKLDNKRPASICLASTSCPSFENNNWMTPPLTPSYSNQLSYFEGVPMKNYVTPSSPTPPRSTPAFEDRAPFAEPLSIATTSGPRPTSLQRSFSSGGYSPVDSTPSSPTGTYSNIYNPARGRGHHFRSFTGGPANPTSPTSPYANAYQRPLPPLHKSYSSYSSSPRSIDLVTPISPVQELPPPQTGGSNNSSSKESASPTCAELLYEKSWVLPEAKTGPMKTMFNFDKIRGDSTVPHIGFAKVTALGSGFGGGITRYGVLRTTQMPIREDAYGNLQGMMTTVLRN
ncbi:hypothetical protein BDZ91DRAFT_558750 [Kalaharituber pfeilii]|nr:hypothetical protein BDZ91DRAFT_558750 [Kalaharituber pfeilii]